MDDGSPMECGGNDAALAGHALGSVSESAPSPDKTEESELPEGWQLLRLGSLCSVNWGNTSITKDSYSDAGFRAYSASGADGFLPSFEHEGEGIVLSAIGARCGKCFWADGKWTAIKNTIVIKAVDEESTTLPFLFYYLNDESIWPRSGTSQPFIGMGKAAEVLVPQPPIAEQQAIAGVLRTVQGAKEGCERVLAATRQLKESLLHHLLTYGPVPLPQAAHVPLKETEIGEVPESWRPTTLGQVAHIGYGVQAAVAHLKDSSKGTPILTNINITRSGDIDLTTLRYYEVPQAKRQRFILKKGDVLFNWRSGSQEHVGKTALFMLDGEYTHSSFILRMRCSGALRPQFLAKYLHWLRSRRYFARTRQQSSVNSVFNKSLSETIPVLLPPIEIQDEIARQLSAVDAKLAAEESRRAALAALFQSLLHYLMTGQVRVPLACGGKRRATPLSPST